MKKKGLITEEVIKPKVAKAKNSRARHNITYTEEGAEWLIKNELFGLLYTITTILKNAKTPKMQAIFQKNKEDTKTRQEKAFAESQAEYAAKDENGLKKVIELMENGHDEKRRLENKDFSIYHEETVHVSDYENLHKRFGLSFLGEQPFGDLDMPFYEAVKTLFELQLYFSYHIPEPEDVIKNCCIVFSPKMIFEFAHKFGDTCGVSDLDLAYSNFEKAICEIENIQSHLPESAEEQKARKESDAIWQKHGFTIKYPNSIKKEYEK